MKFQRHDALPLVTLPLVTLLLATLLLGGCSFSTGVQSHGAGAYRVEGSSEFGLGKAKEAAFADASTMCAASGERIQEISSRIGTDYDIVGDKYDTFELVFQCVSTGGGQSAAALQNPAQPQPQTAPSNQPAAPNPVDLQRAAAERDRNICSGGGSPREVILACERTLDLGELINTEEAIAHYNIGVAYASLGSNESAINSLGLALQLEPDYLDARILFLELQVVRAQRNPSFDYRRRTIHALAQQYEDLYRLTGNTFFLQEAERIWAPYR